MPYEGGFILGFDPGGRGARGRDPKFGWSVCCATTDVLKPPLETGVATDAWDALLAVKRVVNALGADSALPVLAAGIDAPLYWTKSGFRQTDQVVRNALADKSVELEVPRAGVLEVNSLRGACLVQGVLLAKHLHDTWDLRITETHPKALMVLLKRSRDREFRRVAQRLTSGLGDDHRRDAALSALAAWAMLQERPGWRDVQEDEPGCLQPFNTPVAYWMPIDLPAEMTPMSNSL